MAKAILSKKKKAGGIMSLDFKLHHRATVTKTTRYWYKDRQIDKQNRVESSEIRLHTSDHLSSQSWQKQAMGKDSLFNK